MTQRDASSAAAVLRHIAGETHTLQPQNLRSRLATPADAHAFRAVARRLGAEPVARQHVPYRALVVALRRSNTRSRLHGIARHAGLLCDYDDVAAVDTIALVRALLELLDDDQGLLDALDGDGRIDIATDDARRADAPPERAPPDPLVDDLTIAPGAPAPTPHPSRA